MWSFTILIQLGAILTKIIQKIIFWGYSQKMVLLKYYFLNLNLAKKYFE